jgi:hypothetical protein
MTDVRKDGSGPHGPRFDDGFRPAEHPKRHGAKFDEFSRSPQHNHGGNLFDSNFEGDKGSSFEQALQRVPSHVRALDCGCPSCGHRHPLEDALRAGHKPGGTTKTADPMVDVHKQDEHDLGQGSDDLHAALVASIKKTYGWV